MQAQHMLGERRSTAPGAGGGPVTGMGFMPDPHDLLLSADVASALMPISAADKLHEDLPPQERRNEARENAREGLLEEAPEEHLEEAVVRGPAEEPVQEGMRESVLEAPEELLQQPIQGPIQEARSEPAQESGQETAQGTAQEGTREASSESDAEAVEVGFRKVFRAVQRALQMASYLPAEPPGLTRVAVVSMQGRLIASAALDSPSQARFLLDQLQALGFEERSSTEEIQKLGCDLLVVHTANLEVGEVQGIVRGLKAERWPPEG
jgi:hypothetical protein